MKKLVLRVLPLCLCALFALPVEAAPVAEKQELEVYRGGSVTGQLCAATPDGSGVTYLLTTPPCKGSVSVEADGSFTYVPEGGRRGRDYFGYRAVDGEGCVSQEAVVIVRLLRSSAPPCPAE